MIVKHNGVRFYLDNKIAKDIEIYVNDMFTDEEDIVLVIDGPEGAGKSKFSRQIAIYISYLYKVNHNLDYIPTYKDIHFNLRGYINSSLNGKEYQINILDESRKILNRKRSTGKENVMFTDYLSETRDAKQVHIINLPAYHDLEKYIIMWRMKVFLHVDKYRHPKTKKLIKGTGKVYPIDSRLFYQWDENRYKYPIFSPKKYGGWQFEFPNIESFTDINLYKKKKADERKRKFSQEEKKKENPLKAVARKLHSQGNTIKMISETTSTHRNTISSWLKEDAQCIV